jgi:peptidoglycan/xylan/chitin deacetylase (PgdA/CDA1 family)
MHHYLARSFACFLSLFLVACTGTGVAASQGGVSVTAAVSTSGSAVASPSPSTAPTPVQEYEMTKPAGGNAGYSSVNVAGPYIAMTFDDGPHATLTPRLLDLLAKRNIKVTFFVVGQCVQECPDIVKRAAAEGHEIANHSWSHPAFSKMSDAAVRSQIERTQQAVEQAAGVTPTLLRPPYGAITERQKQWINKTLGLHVILWSVDPLDWKYRNAARVSNAIVKETRSGSIVLAHDIHASTVDAMESTLDQLQAKGFKFVTVSQLMAMEVPATPKPTPAAQVTTSGTQVATPAVRKKRSRQ